MKYLKTYGICLCLLTALALQAQTTTTLHTGLKPGATTHGKNMAPVKTANGKLPKAVTPTKQPVTKPGSTGLHTGVSSGVKVVNAQNSATIAAPGKQTTSTNAATVKTTALSTGKTSTKAQAAPKSAPLVVPAEVK